MTTRDELVEAVADVIYKIAVNVSTRDMQDAEDAARAAIAIVVDAAMEIAEDECEVEDVRSRIRALAGPRP